MSSAAKECAASVFCVFVGGGRLVALLQCWHHQKKGVLIKVNAVVSSGFDLLDPQ